MPTTLIVTETGETLEWVTEPRKVCANTLRMAEAERPGRSAQMMPREARRFVMESCGVIRGGKVYPCG